MSAKPPAPLPLGADVATRVNSLAEELWQFSLDESPVSATFLGDPRGNRRLDERGAAARARRLARSEDFARRLAALPPLPTTDEAGLTQRVMKRHLDDALEEPRHALWELDVDQIFGPHLILPQALMIQRLGSPQDADDAAARIESLDAALAEWQRDLEDGLSSGRTPARVPVERVVAQLERFAAAAGAASPFAALVGRLPASWSEADRARATARVHAAIDATARPACARMHAFLKDRVLPSSRTAPGLCHVAGGLAAYGWRARAQTTTDLAPERIHAIGREELEKNRAEILEIARTEGHAGDVDSYLAGLARDPRLRLGTREEILGRYRAICARMDARLPEVFGRLPARRYEVKAIEEWQEKDAPAAYYQPAPDDGSRPGTFYANTRDPGSWPTYDFEALCFHEAVPGHHLQIAIAQDTPGLPSLRRHGGFNAYMEGWAHYTERLADELGMYSTPHDRVGMLTAQAWRAARLVVDTGLHALGWSRDQAVEVLASARGGVTSDVLNEVDRYIVWPGQALAYKVGSRSITALRERTRARLGARFTLAGFHDEVLRHGALPLALLDDLLARWEP
jgi:uncharacterized protein (DUF885 family)